MLGDKLRKFRVAAGMNQSDLASRVGCSIRTVWQAEAGRGRADIYLRLASVLDLELAGRCLPAADHLGARIQALRRRYGVSQRDLAVASLVSPSTIASMEAGNLGHLAVLERVGHALGAGLTLVTRGRGTSFFSLAATSSAWDSWATPQEILDRLYPVVGGPFDLDPCAPQSGRSRVLARQHLTADDDGLTHEWHGSVYMNPPYGRSIPWWTAKARAETVLGRASSVIGLVPARTDTRWWHGDIAGVADAWLIKGRLSFGDGKQPAPFPSALLLWGGSPGHVNAISQAFPTAQHVSRHRSQTTANSVEESRKKGIDNDMDPGVDTAPP